MNEPFGSNEYGAFNTETASHEAFAELNGLVDEVTTKEESARDLASKLNVVQEEIRVLTQKTIPAKMESLGLDEFKTRSGFKVGVKEDVYAGIKEENRGEAHRWLDENGHAGLLKRDVTVQFNKNQEDAARALAQELGGKFAAVSEKQAVHPSTLKAWVKEMLREGKPFPQELFGVGQVKKVVFTKTGK